MRKTTFALASTLLSFSLAASARTVDQTNSPRVRGSFVESMRKGAAQRSAAQLRGTSSPIPGWTVTQVGDWVIVQDDGTHNCDNLDVYSDTAFASCIGGGDMLTGGNAGAIDAFYAAFPDANPQYVVTWLAWDVQQPTAWYVPIASDTKGVGMRHWGEETYGDVSGLNGWIFMNSIQMYMDGFGGLDDEFWVDFIWGQELEHRFGSYVHYIDGDGNDSKALLGRDDSHWSWYLDTGWSWMEGNAWTQDGDEFRADPATDSLERAHKSDLDLYLMGLIPASAVADSLLITDPSVTGRDGDPPVNSSGAGGAMTIEGKAEWVSIDQVIEAEGERFPSWTNERRDYRVANIVILRSSDDPNDDTLHPQMNEYLDIEVASFARDTWGLSFVDTRIGPPLPNDAPIAAISLPLAAVQGEPVMLSASESSDADGEITGWAWDFGDGRGDYKTGSAVSHAFEKSGTITVTLTVVDDRGGHASVSQSIEVEARDSSSSSPSPAACGCALDGRTSRPWLGMLAPIALLALVARRRVSSPASS